MVSALVLEELCERADARFLPELLRASAPEGALARRLVADPRPWARAQLLAYVDDGCDRPGHRRFVKLLLRLAEGRAEGSEPASAARGPDPELLGHLAHAFDGLIRHRLVERTRWLWQEQRPVSERVSKLVTRVPFRMTQKVWRWDQGLKRRVLVERRRIDQEPARFSLATRRYLQRRVVRALRVLGRKAPAHFRAAASTALALCTDDQLTDGARLLDARALVELCFHGAPALRRQPHVLRLAAGRSFSELRPAPLCPGCWDGDEATAALLALVVKAPALLVRRFAAGLLEQDAAGRPRAIAATALLRLVGAPYADVQLLAARLLEKAPGLEALTPGVWLALLGAAGAHTAPVLAELAARHLRPAALDAAALARLSQAKAAPVARLAAGWLVERSPTLEELLPALDGEVAEVRALVGARVVALVREAAAGPGGEASAARVRDLVDARFADVRALGLALVADDGSPASLRDSPLVWSALGESPFPDVRAFLLSHLQARRALLPEGSLLRLWATTLLSIHGGSRGKVTALRQLAARLVDDDTPEAESEVLLPLVAAALRSTRGPEVKGALAALARAAFTSPTAAARIARAFPALALPGAHGANRATGANGALEVQA